MTFTLDGQNMGVWDNKTGGDAGSSSSQYQLGSMGKQISLGGSPQVANVVLQKLQTEDVERVKKFIYSRVGKGKGLVAVHSLDDEGDIFGDSDHYRVTMIRAKASDINQGSTSAKMFEVELEVDGEIS